MSRKTSIEALMRHDVPRSKHRKAKHPWRVTPPRCDGCGKQPPVCTCKDDPR